MYVRCPDCLSPLWIDSAARRGATAECVKCRKRHALSGADPRGLLEPAAKLAEAHQLDLSTAYSVLLGLLPIERARAGPASLRQPLLERSPPRAPCGPEVSLSSPTQRHSGRLDDEALATRLVERYELPLEVAHDVAEKKIGLRAALLEMSRRGAEPVGLATSRRRIRLQALVVPSLAFFAVLASIGVHLRLQWEEHIREDPNTEMWEEAPDPGTVVRGESLASGSGGVLRDERGNVLEVRGADPQEVLRAYCDARAALVPCEPLENAEDLPADPDVRIVLYRDLEKAGRLYGIEVRREPASRGWVAGDGVHAVPTFAPQRRP